VRNWKLWLDGRKLSAALDAERPLSRGWQRRVAASEQLRRYQTALESLDRALRNSAGRDDAPAPADLHADIMRAIRLADARPAARRFGPRLRLAAAAATLALIVAGAALMLQRQSRPLAPSLPAVVAPVAARDALAGLPQAERVVQQLAGQAELAVFGPLAAEAENLAEDLQDLTAFLLASLP
jgi:hypothetical protein